MLNNLKQWGKELLPLLLGIGIIACVVGAAIVGTMVVMVVIAAVCLVLATVGALALAYVVGSYVTDRITNLWCDFHNKKKD